MKAGSNGPAFFHFITDEVKVWAEKAKAEGKIRFFGFSAHKNMENSLLAAAKLGWIDGIMMSYNYRLMVKNKMKRFQLSRSILRIPIN